MWSVVYIDHFPAHCRVESIRKRWNNTELLVVHGVEHAQHYVKLARFNWPYIEDTDLMPYTRMYQGGLNDAETAFQRAANIFELVKTLRAGKRHEEDDGHNTNTEAKAQAADIHVSVQNVNKISTITGDVDGDKGTLSFVVDGTMHQLVLDVTGTISSRHANQKYIQHRCTTLNIKRIDCNVLEHTGEQFVVAAMQDRRPDAPASKGQVAATITAAIPVLATQLSMLLSAVAATTGDVLELGSDALSTPVLESWVHRQPSRSLLSVDSDGEYLLQNFDLNGTKHHQYQHVALNVSMPFVTSRNTPMNVCVVVPCVPMHTVHLKHVLTSISVQTLPAYKTIVALSETNASMCESVANQHPRISFSCVDAIANPAANRNRGAAECGVVDFISFIDADDAMLPTKLDRVCALMHELDADVVMHSHIDRSLERFPHTVLTASDVRRLHLKQKKLPNDTPHLNIFGLMHSHITVTQKLFKLFQYDEAEHFRYIEDSEYIRRLIDENVQVIYTPECLSVYRNNLSTQWAQPPSVPMIDQRRRGNQQMNTNIHVREIPVLWEFLNVKTEIVLTIKGIGVAACRSAVAHFVEHHRLSDVGKWGCRNDPDCVACRLVQEVQDHNDIEADAAGRGTAMETQYYGDPWSCWRYERATDRDHVPIKTVATMFRFQNISASDIEQAYTRLLSNNKGKSYPRSNGEWPHDKQHLLGRQLHDSVSSSPLFLPPPPPSTWTLPTLQLDAPRAVIVSSFCDMANKLGFDKKSFQRILMTNTVDAELRCLARPLDLIHFQYDPITKQNDLHVAESYPAAKVDFILLSQTLEHVYNPTLVLANLFHALDKGGYLFVSVPFINKRHSGSSNDPNGVFHFTHYTPAGLMAVLMSVGFEVVELESWGNKNYVRRILLEEESKQSWPTLRELGEYSNNPWLPVQTWALAQRPK